MKRQRMSRKIGKITSVCQIPKSNISVGENGKLVLKCTKEFMRDMKDMYDLDVNDQKFLYHLYFNTLDGKFSVTVPNNLAK